MSHHQEACSDTSAALRCDASFWPHIPRAYLVCTLPFAHCAHCGLAWSGNPIPYRLKPRLQFRSFSRLPGCILRALPITHGRTSPAGSTQEAETLWRSTCNSMPQKKPLRSWRTEALVRLPCGQMNSASASPSQDVKMNTRSTSNSVTPSRPSREMLHQRACF